MSRRTLVTLVVGGFTGSIMKDYFYAIAVEDQIMGIDSDFGVYFKEPTIKNISECSVFPDIEGA